MLGFVCVGGVTRGTEAGSLVKCLIKACVGCKAAGISHLAGGHAVCQQCLCQLNALGENVVVNGTVGVAFELPQKIKLA